MEKDTVKRVIGALIMTALLIVVGIIIPLTMGLGTGSIAEQDVANQIDFYQKFYWSLVVIWAVFIAFILIKKNNKYGDSIGFFGIGRKPAFKFLGGFSAFQLTLAGAIIMSSLFLASNLLRLGGFTSLRVLPQQFNPAQSIAFSTLLIPVPENLLLGAVLAIFVLSLTLLAIKYDIAVKDYMIYLFVGAFFVGGIFGVVWHLTAYPSSDLAKYVIFMFWGLQSVINLATGFFVISLLMHMSNNFFIDFSRLYSSDVVLVSMVLFIVGLIALYIFLYRNNLFGQGKKSEKILT